MENRAPLELPPSIPLAPPPDLGDRLAAIGVTVDAVVLERLGVYLGHLLAMNEQMNLTAIRDPADAWERHILDALTLVPCVPTGAALVDVGSGGGIPGLPLAIARPDLRITLVESIQKKAGFLWAVTEAMKLENVRVSAERAEQLDERGIFDVVTARAVAKLATLVPLVIPLVRAGGTALLIKGQKADEELAEAAKIIKRAGAEHAKTIPTPTGRIVVLNRLR